MIRRFLILLFVLCPLVLRAQDQETQDDFVDRIHAQFNLMDYIGCIETCNKLEAFAPKNPEAYFFKATSKLYLGDLKGAEVDMKLAAKNGGKPSDPAIRFWTDEVKRRKLVSKSFYNNGEKLIPELDYRPRYTRKDSLRGALRPERTCFDVTFYNLNLKIDPKKKFISGTTGITFKVVEPTKRLQIDLFARYKIQSITWQNKPLKYKREFDAVFIDFPENIAVGNLQTVAITYSGKPVRAPKPPWDGGFVWERDKKENYWCGVACEHFGASSWWPNKDHGSDEADSVLLTFTVPDGYDLISNGRFRGVKPADKGYTSHTWFVADPINNYDVSFYLGKYSHFSDTLENQQGKLPMDFYVLPYHLEEARACFAQTKEVLEYYQKAFGDFPFMKDKFGMVESPYEGMEHQGAIAYGNDFNKTDEYAMYLDRRYDYIIVHESAHEWWGNSVTARDMADIWIQEGFATYAEMMFMENKNGYANYLKEMKRKMEDIYNVWPLVENYNVNENAFASNDCYTKGAAILHNLRCTIENDTLFFKLIHDFAIRYQKKQVTSTDFTSMVNEYTHQDYTAFFKKFLYDKNLPVLLYTYRREGKDIVVTYQWDGVDKGFVMPFGITADNDNQQMRLVGTTEPQEITIKNTNSFRFYTSWLEPGTVPRDAYTYYWTRCGNR
jgi:aminopeptidase N